MNEIKLRKYWIADSKADKVISTMGFESIFEGYGGEETKCVILVSERDDEVIINCGDKYRQTFDTENEAKEDLEKGKLHLQNFYRKQIESFKKKYESSLK